MLSNVRGFPWLISTYFATTCEPEMLESPSDPLKTRIIAKNKKKLWSTKSDGLFDSQGMTSSSKCKQICINILSLFKHQQKTRDLKLKFFCSLNYKSSRVFRGFEQLSSSFWQRVTAIYGSASFSPYFSNFVFGFWSIILVPDTLESRSRALKTRMII